MLSFFAIRLVIPITELRANTTTTVRLFGLRGTENYKPLNLPAVGNLLVNQTLTYYLLIFLVFRRFYAVAFASQSQTRTSVLKQIYNHGLILFRSFSGSSISLYYS